MDDDLRLLLRSPALSLEPAADLSAVVRRRARQHRRRVRTAAASVTAALVVAGVLIGPSLQGSIDDLSNGRDQTAKDQTDARAPAATTEVVTIQNINGAELITWFEGARWCTAIARQTTKDACLGPVNPEHEGFSWVMPSGSPSLTVDDVHVVAGLLPPGASRVRVRMKGGREYAAAVVDGARFVMPVWSARIDDSAYPVEYFVAYDNSGREIARKPA